MDKKTIITGESVEMDFVKKCIKREYHDRILYELKSTKREKALYRFAHSSYEMINEKFKNTSLLEIQNFISSSFNELEDCYVISGNIHDKKNMSLKNTFFQFCNSDMMMIIICKNWVFIKEESVENKYYYTDSFN